MTAAGGPNVPRGSRAPDTAADSSTASRARRYGPIALHVGVAAAVAAMVAFAFVQRWHLLTVSPYPVGIDGYFYPLQVRHLLEHGTLQYPSSPLTFYFMTPFALATDPITGAKLGAALGGALIAIPAYGVGARLGGSRGAGLLAAALMSASAGGVYLSLEFVKQGIGLTVGLAALWCILRALDAPSERSAWIAAIAAIAAFATHKLAGVMLVIVVLPAVAYEVRHRLHGRRLIYALLATAGVLLAIVVLGAVAPQRFPSLTDLALIGDAFTPTARWDAPALVTEHLTLAFDHEAAAGGIVALVAALVLGARLLLRELSPTERDGHHTNAQPPTELPAHDAVELRDAQPPTELPAHDAVELRDPQRPTELPAHDAVELRDAQPPTELRASPAELRDAQPPTELRASPAELRDAQPPTELRASPAELRDAQPPTELRAHDASPVELPPTPDTSSPAALALPQAKLHDAAPPSDRRSVRDVLVGWMIVAVALGIALPWLAVTDAQGIGFRLRIAAFVPLALCAAIVARAPVQVVRIAALLPLPPALLKLLRFADLHARRGVEVALVAVATIAFVRGMRADRTEGRVLTHPALAAAVMAADDQVPAGATVIVPERHILFMAAWYTRAPVSLRPEPIPYAQRVRMFGLVFIQGMHSPLDRALDRARSEPSITPPLGLHPRYRNGLVLVTEPTWDWLLAQLPVDVRAYFRAWPTI